MFNFVNPWNSFPHIKCTYITCALNGERGYMSISNIKEIWREKRPKVSLPLALKKYLLSNMTRRQLFRSRYWKKIYNFYLKLSSKSWFGLVYLQDTIRSMFHALCYEYLSFFFFFPSSLLDMQQFYLVNLFSTQQTMSESHWGILPDAIYRLNLNSQRALFYPI